MDLESRVRANQKQIEERDKEFDRVLQEKYEAQNRQFKLQQEFNVNTSK